jgi:RNA polymerase sigma factor (TIGR02999 family)
MTMESGGDFTELLHRAQAGDADALDGLIGRLYQDFRTIAARRMRRERRGHTLQPTALANEALIKILSDNTLANATDRTFFYKAASKAMNQVLFDHEKKRKAKKGPGRLRRHPLDSAFDYLAAVEHVPLMGVREALEDLARLSARGRLVVEMHFFLGISLADVAVSLGLSQRTVERDWAFARGWLYEKLKPGGD